MLTSFSSMVKRLSCTVIPIGFPVYIYISIEINKAVVWVHFSKLVVSSIPLNFSGCFKTLV